MTQVQLQRAARLADLEVGLPFAVTLPDGQRICLVRDNGTVYAVADRCPHRDFALSGGDLVGPCVLECPWHGARFDVRNGNILQGPATERLATYSVRVVGEEVFVGARRAT
jgi:3-phenylpropionate/trans-cinnamate dioxygenase ferredoxin subunit